MILLALAFAGFVRVNTPKVVLTHVNVIDGTGAPAIADRNVVIENGKIVAITAGADQAASDGVTVLDLHGDSVMPGIVGMHEHLFYLTLPAPEAPSLFMEMPFSAPRLYLANGVTTIRTAGGVEPASDLKLKAAIDAGTLPGPHIDVTGPYLDGPGSPVLQMLPLRDANDARETVAYWSDRGVTSYKAYAHITRDELRAAVQEAHKRGLKVTGHLCSVTYDEAIDAGIDNLEHGFEANTALDPGKTPDTCSKSGGYYTILHMTQSDSDRLIAKLIAHHVAITSTLPNLASSVMPEPVRAEMLQAMSPAAREAFLERRNHPRPPNPDNAAILRKDMDLQRAFVAAGGLLIAGADPVGLGGVLPGFGDQRELELLVEAGFTPLQAIRIATLNGATYLGRQDQIGSIVAGKNADLIVIKGDPSARIHDVENVDIVFKDGVGYDRQALLDSVKGHYGEY